MHRHSDISREITVESLPLHIASSQAQTGNLICTYVILLYIYIACFHLILTLTHLVFGFLIFVYIYNVIRVLLTLLRKKENAFIIHSAMETWKYTIIRNFINLIILCLCTPLDSEPGTTLVCSLSSSLTMN